MVYSRLDVNLALYVARWRGHELRQESLADLDNKSFKTKLDLVLAAAHQEYGDNAACVADWQAWLQLADELRCKRNDLMHGRWGIYEQQGFVSNVLGLPGLPTQHEVKYTLDDLAAEVELAEQVARQFWKLRTKWPV
jgi:hypothetical protein